MKAIDKFRELAAEERFKGWPLVGQPESGPKIPFFGETINYKLQTGANIEEYTSIIRNFGWAVCFGIVRLLDEKPSEAGTGREYVVTLCQWKPGVNQASWELPPGGIGKVDPKATIKEITQKTREIYLKETGLSSLKWQYLGRIMIETGKYRGAGPDDHGLSAHLFLAENLQYYSIARKPAPNEIMETLLVPIEEFPEVLDSGLFVEESAVACAYKALLHLGRLNWA